MWVALSWLLAAAFCSEIRADPQGAGQSQVRRTQGGLEALFDFRAIEDAVVKDLHGGDPPLDLRITEPKAVRPSGEGLEIIGKTLLRTEQPATRLSESIQQSNALTLEAWVRPARADQRGPARIVTLSRSPGERNVTLGQEGDSFEVRLRTTETSTNGIPAVASTPMSAKPAFTHVVYTRDRAGKACLYIDGKLNVERQVGGSTSNWDAGLQLALANELSGDRPWHGTYRLVAIYSRNLSPDEVQKNFQAGVAVDPASEKLRQEEANARLFQVSLAPILSKHCLECHDTATKKGKLDLSRRAAALAGGRKGPAIVPGKAEDSLLWQLVEANEMPHDRPPLSGEEKKIVRGWLDGGATWSLDVIDPAVYAHNDGPQKVFVQRLTVPEYIETVRSTLGVDIAKEAFELLPIDQLADGFRNTAYNLKVDLAHVRAYAELAEVITGRIDIKALARRHTESREMTDENITNVIKPLGAILLRGPLSNGELARYCGISTTVASAGGDFEESLRYLIEAMLQSPRFLYRIEGQRGDGSARPVDQYELATRMSYIVWGAPPDEELLGAAEKAKLDRAEVEKQVRRMLKDPRAIARSRQFVSEWLDLDRLDNLRPRPEKFPRWKPELAADMRRETLAFFEEVVWKQNRPLSDLLKAPVTFVTPELARHYGLPLDKQPDGEALIRYDLSSIPGRGGLLTQGSTLTVGGDEASMVTRGLFILHELLRGSVRDPPPCVDTTPVPTKPGLTQRAVSETRLANNRCSGCHAKFEPLAFGLEKFDGLGTYHAADEHGNELREDGDILIPGEEKPSSYASTAEMLKLLAASDRVGESLTWKVTQFALGRPLGAADAAMVADIHRRAREGGGTYASLVSAIVASDLVQLTPTEPTDATP